MVNKVKSNIKLTLEIFLSQSRIQFPVYMSLLSFFSSI